MLENAQARQRGKSARNPRSIPLEASEVPFESIVLSNIFPANMDSLIIQSCMTSHSLRAKLKLLSNSGSLRYNFEISRAERSDLEFGEFPSGNFLIKEKIELRCGAALGFW